MKKIKTSFSLTPKTKQLIDILANKLELSKTYVVTLAIGQLFRILIDKSDPPTVGYTWGDDDLSQEIDIEKLANEVGKQFVVNLEPIAEAINILSTEIGELREWKNKQENKHSVKNSVKLPRFAFEWKRVNEKDEVKTAEAREINI